MSEINRIVPIVVGSSIEYYDCEGDVNTARKILRPYGQPSSPFTLRLDKQEQAAQSLTELLKPASSFFVEGPPLNADLPITRPFYELSRMVELRLRYV